MCWLQRNEFISTIIPFRESFLICFPSRIIDSTTDSSIEGKSSGEILNPDAVKDYADVCVFVCLCMCRCRYFHVICIFSTLCVQAVYLAGNIYSPLCFNAIREQWWQIVLMSLRILCCLLMCNIECKLGSSARSYMSIWGNYCIYKAPL